MSVLVWITEETWAACVDAARCLAPVDQDIILLHVTDTAALDAAHGAFSALLGRSGRDPGTQLDAMAESAAAEVAEAAAARLGRPAEKLLLRGRPEHLVVQAARGASGLIVSRSGTEAGPKSLGKRSRFVVDHAPCPVLLIWPGPPPDNPLPPGPRGDRRHRKDHPRPGPDHPRPGPDQRLE